MHIKDIIPKSLVPQKRESTLPATGNEDVNFELALKSRKIKDAPLEELKEVLRLVMVKVGLRANNWPKDEEKAVLLSHITTHYGGHTAQEILLAFDMGMSGKLNVDMNTYENFSCLYFSDVMNAYRSWAEEQHKLVKEEPPLTEYMNDEEFYDQTAKALKEKKISLELLPTSLTDWLIGRGEIANVARYHLPAARWIGSKLAAGMDKDTVKDYTEFKQMYQQGAFSGKWIGQIERLSKQMALNDYILKK